MEKTNPPAQWDYSTDLLIIGSGAGGLTSAIIAKDLDADVLVIDKSKLYGGTTAMSGGNVWIPCNPQMEALGYSDTQREAMTYLKQTVGKDVPEDKLRSYLQTGPALIRYLQKHTPVQFAAGPLPDYYASLPGGKAKYRALDPVPISARQLGDLIQKLRPPHPLTIVAGVAFTTGEIATVLTKGKGWLTTVYLLAARQFLDIPWRLKSKLPRRLTLGNALIARCLLASRERDIPIRLETSFDSLLLEDGRVVGITAVCKGKSMRIQARQGVVIAAGGFSHNAAMRAEFLPRSPDAQWSVAPAEDTGDGIQGGRAIGGDIHLMEEAWWSPVFQLPVSKLACAMFMDRSFPGSLIVNQQGQRFMNEAANYDEVGRAIANAGSTASPAYYIFDSRYRRRYLAGPLLPMPSFMDVFLNRDRKKLMLKANTLAGLSAKLDLPAKALEETVNRYNQFSEKGFDIDFHRGEDAYERHYSDPKVGPNSTLAPLTSPPYYAIPVYPGDIGTRGGLVTDRDARVLKPDGIAIPGLYAVGNSSASVMGRSYPGGGATIGPAMVFGARAAMSATGKSLPDSDF